MPPKKRTRPALKTDGVKTRAAERKELTRRQADLHASSLISQAEAVLSFCAPTDEVDVVSPGPPKSTDKKLPMKTMDPSMDFLIKPVPRLSKEAKEKIEADVAALNVKIQSQLANKHSLELHCASLGSHLDQEKEKSQTLAHEVDKLTAAKDLLSGHMDYLVKAQEQMKMLLDKDRLTIKALEVENLKLNATCSDLHVQITKGLKDQIKQSERTVVAYEARDKSRDLLKLMTESTRKVAGLLEAVKKENIMLKAKINESERLQQDQIASK